MTKCSEMMKVLEEGFEEYDVALDAIRKVKVTPDMAAKSFEGERPEKYGKDFSVSYGNREASVYMNDKLYIFDVNDYGNGKWVFSPFDIVDNP